MNDDTAVLAIYCIYKEQTEQTLLALLGSLWKQLVLRRGFSKTLQKEHEEHTKRQSRPTAKELQDSIIAEIEHVEHVYVVVDALDECREDVLQHLVSTLRSLSRKCQLLFTSRPLLTIENLLSGFTHLMISAKTKDMMDYIDGRMYPGSRLMNLIESHPHADITKASVIETIVGKADGM